MIFHVLVFIYQLYDKRKHWYRAFCAGSIITKDRVITSAHCFLSNRKRKKRNFDHIRVVGGALTTMLPYYPSHSSEQWRMIAHLYTQRFYRFPMFSLAIVKVNEEWDFNQFVNKIPYAKWDQDFDGVCYGTTVRTTKSWSSIKNLFPVTFRLITRKSCEHRLLRDCEAFYCTEYDIMSSSSSEIEGGGLICFGTNDPKEHIDGVLVGVTTLINVGLPSLHNRVGIHYKWITGSGVRITFNLSLLMLILILNIGVPFSYE